jgi:hypothetical protein
MSGDKFWFVLSIVVLSFYGIRWFLRRRAFLRSQSWPVVTGRVTSTSTRLEKRGDQPFHAGEIVYAYLVGEREYTGSWKRYFILHSRVEGWLGGYPEGHPLVIHYNPELPGDSVPADAHAKRSGK